MGASGSMIGLIFGIYPLVIFVVAPLIGVIVSNAYPVFVQGFLSDYLLLIKQETISDFKSMQLKNSYTLKV